MITPEDLRTMKQKQFIKAVFASEPGDGKTHLTGTFPKLCSAVTVPGEMDTITSKPELMKNLVGFDNFFTSDNEDAYAVIIRLRKFITEEVKPKILKGEIETFSIDNGTFLAELFWKKIRTTDKDLYRTKGGQFDTRSAYGALKDELLDFFLTYVLSLPCHIIINVHMMVEDDEVLAKKKHNGIPYNLAVLGGFRDKLAAMVSYVFYLSKEYIEKDKKYVYLVRTNFGAGKRAKSRLTLPSVITGASYAAINGAIEKSIQASAVAEQIISQTIERK